MKDLSLVNNIKTCVGKRKLKNGTLVCVFLFNASRFVKLYEEQYPERLLRAYTCTSMNSDLQLDFLNVNCTDITVFKTFMKI